jgi:hypothetical protein
VFAAMTEATVNGKRLFLGDSYWQGPNGLL